VYCATYFFHLYLAWWTPAIFRKFSLSCLLFQLSFQPVVAQQDTESASNETVKETLIEKWEYQREDMSLVEISYRSVRSKVPREHYVTRDDARKLVRKLVKSSDRKTFNDVAAALDPRLKGNNTTWSKGVFLLDGQSFLSEVAHPAIADLPHTVVRHGGYELHSRFLNKDRVQVDVMWEQTKIKRGPEGISDFVALPPRKFINDAQIEVTENERLISISNQFAELFVASDTGFVHEFRKGKNSSRSYKEIVQFKPKKHGEDIVMPELYFDAKYVNKHLSFFTLRLIDAFTTDPKAMTKDFRISALPGDNVIDHTGEVREMVKVSRATDDVLTLIHDSKPRRIPLRSKR